MKNSFQAVSGDVGKVVTGDPPLSIYLSIEPQTDQPGGGIWAPAFAGATNTSPPGPSMLLTQALKLGETGSGAVFVLLAGAAAHAAGAIN